MCISFKTVRINSVVEIMWKELYEKIRIVEKNAIRIFVLRMSQVNSYLNDERKEKYGDINN